MKLENLSVRILFSPLVDRMTVQARIDLLMDAAINRSDQQLNRGLVGELVYAPEGNGGELNGVAKVVFGTRRRQLLPVLWSMSNESSLPIRELTPISRDVVVAAQGSVQNAVY